jgi:cupin 2 domain-containing protein
MKQNLFDQVPEKAPKELFTELLSANDIRIERIVSFGQVSPNGFWYEQAENEWILLLEGSAQIRFDNRLIALAPGDYLNIQAGTRHRVEKTATDGRTVWLAVFYK